jgi:peptidoglycan hydrolase-like protein with peptidoglycan-binding domain
VNTAGVARRTFVIAGAAAAAGVAAGGLGWWRLGGPDAAGAPPSATNVRTVAVVRTDLVAREQVGGTLGYAGEWRIGPAGPAGVLTAVPALGTIVQRGQSLYEVDGRPVPVLYGERPAWRDLATGVPRGADVRQLEQNLSALGHLRSTVDDRYTAATAAAVRRWQGALGVAQTGRLPLGAVVFVPEPVRVAAVDAPLGARVGAEPVLRLTSNRRVVTVELPTNRQGNVRVGGPVLVTLPGGSPARATVTDVGRVAVSTPAEPGRPVGPATITVTATLDRPDLAGTLDRVPVQVAVTTGERRGVLAVPVTALLAAGADGYEVVVVEGASRLRVGVRPGLHDESSGLVEVTGSGLAEGLLVEVPLR